MYYWTRNIGMTVNMVVFVVACLSTRANESGQLNHIIFLLTSALFITIALSLDFVFSEVLNKDHKKQNPMQVVKKVLIYSFKHKRPLRRSAFMFNPSFNPTRIDYATSYFGGPFTFEQVENVKTFLNMLKIIIVFGCFVFLQTGVSVCVCFHFQALLTITSIFASLLLLIVTSSPLRYVSVFSTLSKHQRVQFLQYSYTCLQLSFPLLSLFFVSQHLSSSVHSRPTP